MNPARRQLGINRAKRMIRNNDNWIHRFQYLISTRVPCSCMMCGNPRRYFNEKTIQELKADVTFQEQL